MIREALVNIARFALFLYLQGVLFNHMDLFDGLAYPMPYVFAMFMLPFGMPRWSVMLIGFLYGIGLDAFTNTLGLHASACVFLGYIQPVIEKMVPVREHFGVVDQPTIASRGLRWYMTYTAILISLHHTWVFIVEWFKMTDLLWMFGKILLSTAYTFALVLLIQIIAFSKAKAN